MLLLMIIMVIVNFFIKHLLPLFDDVVQPLTPGEVNKPHPPNLRVLNHWQRIVDDTVWTMSVVIANDCPR